MNSTWSVKNKVCVITGSSSGLGLMTIKKLRDEGAELVLIVRNEKRKTEMISDFPNAHFFFADFSNMTAVYQVAEKIKSQFSKIDLLKNNAGVISYDKITLTEENIESTLAINYLSHYILTQTLIPNLTHEHESRIVSTGSLVHRQAVIDFSDLYHSKNYKPMKMYATSKMALVMYSHFLGEQLKATKIRTHCVDPGAVATQISRSRGKFFNFIFSFGKYFLTNLKKGSQTNIYACISPSLSTMTSTYLVKEQLKSAHQNARDIQKWNQLEKWTLAKLKELKIHL